MTPMPPKTGVPAHSSLILSTSNSKDTNADVQKLQQQLQDIKEQVNYFE